MRRDGWKGKEGKREAKKWKLKTIGRNEGEKHMERYWFEVAYNI